MIFIILHSLWVLRRKEAAKGTLRELYSAMKTNFGSRIYISMFLVRRILFIVLLLSIKGYVIIKLIVMVVIQSIYYTYLVRFRPFDDIKANIIEIINETSFCYFLLWLFYYNSKEVWSETTSSIMLTVILMNSLMALGVILGKLC